MIHSDGKSWPPKPLKKRWYRAWDRLRAWSTRDVEIADGDAHYRFRCGNLTELTRCMSLFTKEAGTCEWIRNEVGPGDVFYDIGANIGIYTVLAAHRTGGEGRVFAFEPHAGNFARLLEHIEINGLQDSVVACSFALYDEPGFFPFNYSSNTVGTANSQLSTMLDGDGSEYRPVVSETKYATTIDSLLDSATIEAPTRPIRPPSLTKRRKAEVIISSSLNAILRCGLRRRHRRIRRGGGSTSGTIPALGA